MNFRSWRMGRQSCNRWSWALWPREPTKKCQLCCQQRQQHQHQQDQEKYHELVPPPHHHHHHPPYTIMAEGAELKSENWVMVVSEQHRYQGVSYKSDIIVISGIFYFFSSYLTSLKWPWMIWSHFDNAETLNSNTSAMVLLRLDTSPKRVALLTAPNPLCYLFVLIKAKKTLFCQFWKYKQNRTILLLWSSAVPSRLTSSATTISWSSFIYSATSASWMCAFPENLFSTCVSPAIIAMIAMIGHLNPLTFNHCALHIIPIYRCQGIV